MGDELGAVALKVVTELDWGCGSIWGRVSDPNSRFERPHN